MNTTSTLRPTEADTSLSNASFSRIVFTGLAVYILYHVFQTYWKLRDIPGPFLARITNWQRVFWVKTRRAHEHHQKAHEKYGDCVRFGPHMVSISDPAEIPTLYPMRAGFPKSLFYRGIMPYSKGGAFPAVFTTQDEEQHRQLKNPIAHLYSLTNVVNFERFVDEVMGVLFQELDQRFVDSKEICDLGDWLQFFAFDVMGTMTFSKRYGFLETGIDVNGMLGAIWDFMLTIGPMTQIAWFDKLIYKSRITTLFNLQVAVPILKVVSDATIERQQVIDDDKAAAIEGGSGDGDFLSCFLELQKKNKSIPSWSARAWTFSNVIAGSDSTTVVMRTVLYHILAYPETFEKIMKELLDVQRTSGLTLPYPRWNEVKDLPYLDACIQEAVRLHPPFCLPLERVVPKSGVTMCGRYFPEGTCIGMNPYVVNRHKPTFGEDANCWRPERWLAGDAEYRRKLDASIMTFGAGKRSCLGKHIAMLEIKKIVPALLLNYDLNLIDSKAYWVENSYFFRQGGMNVNVKRRTTTSEF